MLNFLKSWFQGPSGFVRIAVNALYFAAMSVTAYFLILPFGAMFFSLFIVAVIAFAIYLNSAK